MECLSKVIGEASKIKVEALRQERRWQITIPRGPLSRFLVVQGGCLCFLHCSLLLLSRVLAHAVPACDGEGVPRKRFVEVKETQVPPGGWPLRRGRYRERATPPRCCGTWEQRRLGQSVKVRHALSLCFLRTRPKGVGAPIEQVARGPSGVVCAVAMGEGRGVLWEMGEGAQVLEVTGPPFDGAHRARRVERGGEERCVRRRVCERVSERVSPSPEAVRASGTGLW